MSCRTQPNAESQKTVFPCESRQADETKDRGECAEICSVSRVSNPMLARHAKPEVENRYHELEGEVGP